jgi:uncharacterized membrane protein
VTDTTRATAVHVVRHPVHALLAPVPIVCFTGALLTDIAYWRSPDMQWANFSAWLLCVGMVFAVLAAIAGIVDHLTTARAHRPRANAGHVIGAIVVLVLALINNFVHSRDAWTSVVPAGLTLSVLTVLAMLVTGFLSGRLVYRTTTTHGEIR